MKSISKVSISIAFVLTSTIVTAAPSVAANQDEGPRLKSYAVSVSTHSKAETLKGRKDGVSAKGWGWGSATIFSFGNPSTTADSQYGRFTGQIHYGTSVKKTFAWGFKLHKSTAAAARGMMSESARLYLNGKATGYKDTHPSVAANYLVHSSTKVVVNKPYTLVIDEKFPIARGGTRHIRTEFDFIVHTM